MAILFMGHKIGGRIEKMKCRWCLKVQTKKNPLRTWGDENVSLCYPCADQANMERLLYRLGRGGDANLPGFIIQEWTRAYTNTGAIINSWSHPGISNRKYEVKPNINQRGHRKKRKELIISKRVEMAARNKELANPKNVRVKDKTYP